MKPPSLEGMRRRKRMRYFFAAAMLFIFGWMLYFFGVAIHEVPAFFIFPLIVSSGAAFFVAYNVLPDADAGQTKTAEIFLIATNVILIVITMGALFVAAYAAQKDMNYFGGLYLAGANLLIHMAGGLGHYAQTEIDLEYFKEMERLFMEKRREDQKKKKEEQQKKKEDVV